MTTRYEYRVIPAPLYGQRAQGVKGAQARFAHAVEEVMNEMAQEGWEYQRADILPSEERQSHAPGATTMRSLLVFRRPIEDHLAQYHEPPTRRAGATADQLADATAALSAAAYDDDDDEDFPPHLDEELAADVISETGAETVTAHESSSGRRKRRHPFTRTGQAADGLSDSLRRRAEHMFRNSRDA